MEGWEYIQNLDENVYIILSHIEKMIANFHNIGFYHLECILKIIFA